jgi:UDPglucose 6-dehydrogenase
MRLAVVGTGYVGLVTGTCLAEVGHDVVCVDIDETKVARLKKGEVPIYEPGLADLVTKNAAAGRLHFTTSLKEIGSPTAIFFALPTPPGAGGEADLSFVLAAAKDVAGVITDYTVLINKSTVPVGTAQKVRAAVVAGTKVPFDVVSNPEFLREGFAISDCMNADRIVVGTSSEKARAVMEEIYAPFTTTGVPLIVMDEASSEMTKYAANSFLATKITFINEIANMCERVGANVDFVRQGIGTDSRIGNRFLNPGIGYGGSCFPKDVMALHRAAAAHDYTFRLLDAVMQANEQQKQVLVHKVVEHYGENLKGKTFALWGLAFKPDTDDIREAPSLEIIRELLGRGAQLKAYDPEAAENVQKLFPANGEIAYTRTSGEALKGADALLIVTEWKEFAAASPALLKKELADKLVFDGRNVFDVEAMEHSGLTYLSIGRKVIGDA